MMENYTNIQSLLLKWFKHHGTRSFSQIRVACRNLNESFSTNLERPHYDFFFPLLRKGYLEFIGKERYQIAPPVIIFNKKNYIATAVNLTYSQTSHINKSCEIDGQDLFGVIRFNSNMVELKRICDNLKIQLSDNHIAQALRQFPALKDIITCFDSISGSQCNIYYNIFKNSWEYVDGENCLGIHKLNNDARQYYFRMDPDLWLKIPSSKVNPDSWYICECFQAILCKKCPFIFYNKENRILSVKDITIPILIDRILRIPSIHLKNNKEREYQNISYDAYKQLSRIFINGIGIL